jgi:predicted ATPase
MLQSLHIRGYRSLRDFRLELGRVTVVSGENGVGKSNLYRALALMQRMADGRFAEALAEEGGMPSLLWAGERRADEPRRISWKLDHSDFHLSLECGISAADLRSAFQTDPDVKEETLRYGGAKGRIVAKRKGPTAELRDQEGRMQVSPLPFHASESMLSEVRDGIRFPALAATREVFLRWRFYHQFRTDFDSAMRRPRLGSWSPVLAHDGSNLAATLQTIIESGFEDPLNEAVEAAFPGLEWNLCDGDGIFQLKILRPGLKRYLTANELSDGTLRFFCLCAALLTTKPPPLLVLNEPENSLHPDLLMPLAGLIERASRDMQIIVVTHAQPLAEAIRERCDARLARLIAFEGETRLEGEGTARRVWTFDG